MALVDPARGGGADPVGGGAVAGGGADPVGGGAGRGRRSRSGRRQAPAPRPSAVTTSYSRPRDRLDRQAAAFLRHHHLLESRGPLQGREGDGGREPLDELDVHHVPDRIGLGAAGVEVLVAGLPGVVVGVAGAADRGEAGDPRRVGVRRVEQDAVAHLHHVAQEVARLEVADPFPAGPPVAGEVVDRVGGRLALHQPVASGHRMAAPLPWRVRERRPVLPAGDASFERRQPPVDVGNCAGQFRDRPGNGGEPAVGVAPQQYDYGDYDRRRQNVGPRRHEQHCTPCVRAVVRRSRAPGCAPAGARDVQDDAERLPLTGRAPGCAPAGARDRAARRRSCATVSPHVGT